MKENIQDSEFQFFEVALRKEIFVDLESSYIFDTIDAILNQCIQKDGGLGKSRFAKSRLSNIAASVLKLLLNRPTWRAKLQGAL